MSHGMVWQAFHEGVFQWAAIERLEQGGSVGEAARALEVNPNVLQRWRREFRQGPGNAFPGLGQRRWAEGRVAELERKIGQQAWEIDFLKGSWQRIEEPRLLQAARESRSACPARPRRGDFLYELSEA